MSIRQGEARAKPTRAIYLWNARLFKLVVFHFQIGQDVGGLINALLC